MKSVIGWTITAVILWVLVISLLQYFEDIPEVHWSISKDECIEVMNFNSDSKSTCEDLPEIYKKVWVK